MSDTSVAASPPVEPAFQTIGQSTGDGAQNASAQHMLASGTLAYLLELASTEDTGSVKGSIVRVSAISALMLYEITAHLRQAALDSTKLLATTVQPQIDKLRADLQAAQDKQTAAETEIGNLHTAAATARQQAEQQNVRIAQNEDQLRRLFEHERAVSRDVRELTEENLPLFHQELSEAHGRLAVEQDKLAARIVELSAALARLDDRLPAKARGRR